jgi:hypothetical protein
MSSGNKTIFAENKWPHEPSTTLISPIGSETGVRTLISAKKCSACDVETQAEPRFEYLE